MSDNVGKVVKFTNITNKDFEHPFGGQPFVVKAGVTVMFPFDLADHLATHLARRIFIEGDKSLNTYDPNDATAGVGKPLWDDVALEAMKRRILGDVFEQEQTKPKSEMELLKEKVDQLQQQYADVLATKAAPKSEAAPVTTNNGSEGDAGTLRASDKSENLGYQDKAQVISQLEAKGIKFDRRQSKANLEKLLV